MFEPQNPLEQSLVKAANDPSYRPQFYRENECSPFYQRRRLLGLFG